MDEKESANYFSKFAFRWSKDAYTDDPHQYPLGQKRLDLVLNFIDKSGKSFSNAIDFGCGPGKLLVELARRGVNCQGVDASTQMLDEARKNIKMERKEVQSLISFHHSKWENYVLANSATKVDLITALGFVYYLDNLENFIGSCSTLLKQSGYLILSSRNEEFKRNSNFLADQLEQIRYTKISPKDLVPVIAKLRQLEENPAVKEPDKKYSSVAKSFKLSLIDQIFKKYDFSRVEAFGLHPHFLHPAFDNDIARPLVDAFSILLSQVPDSPLRWHSHFICVYKKN